MLIVGRLETEEAVRWADDGRATDADARRRCSSCIRQPGTAACANAWAAAGRGRFVFHRAGRESEQL